jgi:hypothetical protein
VITRVAHQDSCYFNWCDKSVFSGYEKTDPAAAGSLMKLLGYYQRTAPDSWSRKKFMQIRGYTSYYEPFGKWAGLVFWLEMTKAWYFQSESFV